MTTMFLIIAAIIIAIACGEKFQLNSGIIAVALGYIIGSSALGLVPDKLFILWPTELFIVIFGVSFFFNFANANGTLEILGSHVVYIFRNHMFWLPLGLYWTTGLISALGGGVWSSVPIVGALALQICKKTQVNPLIVSIAVIQGGMTGGNIAFGPHGAIIQSLLSKTSLASQAFTLTNQIFLVSFFYPMIIVFILMLLDNRKRTHQTIVMDKPKAFDLRQKQTLKLIAAFVLLMLVIPIAANFFPDSSWISAVKERLNLGFIGIVFGIIAYMMKLSDGQEVFRRTPWDTIWLTCGMAFLIGVGAQGGIIEQLAGLITHIPALLVPVVLTFVCGIMSIFSSTVGVVAPLFFPTLPAIYAASGISPSLLAICIIIGGFSTGGAPFSDAGSLLLSSSGYDFKQQKKLQHTLLFQVAPVCICGAVITAAILTLFFKL